MVSKLSKEVLVIVALLLGRLVSIMSTSNEPSISLNITSPLQSFTDSSDLDRSKPMWKEDQCEVDIPPQADLRDMTERE